MSAATWHDVARARRILLHGVTGSGKSTLARALSDVLDLPVTLADEELWLPGWVPVPEPEQDEIVARWLAREEWVVDTAYGRHRTDAVARADVVVALDYPRWLSLGRLLRRTARRIVTQEQQCNGNTETLGNVLGSDSIVRWHFRSWRRKRETMREWHADASGPPVVLLEHPRDAEELLRRLPAHGRDR